MLHNNGGKHKGYIHWSVVLLFGCFDVIPATIDCVTRLSGQLEMLSLQAPSNFETVFYSGIQSFSSVQ